ncbi:MAG: methyltransferase domain-containing protein [Spirochaetes bacterium]|nr:methyltransferase domain-containing protein [Spirochaetota bacterium]
MKYLNIGCGYNYHPDWENIDIISVDSSVKEWDIRDSLPYKSNVFNAVYSSHVLEHLEQEDALRQLSEMYRVLKHGGVIRLVVPNLEAIIKTYINKLNEVVQGKKESQADYDWIMLELIDQIARVSSGGRMYKFLVNPEIKNKDFIISRIGNEAKQFWQKTEEKNEKYIKRKKTKINKYSLLKKIIEIIAGRDAVKAFEEGLFRNSGEVHRWMYDRFSLKRLLEESGFKNIIVSSAFESRISNFNSFELDVINGEIRKPDSLFMEGIK